MLLQGVDDADYCFLDALDGWGACMMHVSSCISHYTAESLLPSKPVDKWSATVSHMGLSVSITNVVDEAISTEQCFYH